MRLLVVLLALTTFSYGIAPAAEPASPSLPWQLGIFHQGPNRYLLDLGGYTYAPQEPVLILTAADFSKSDPDMPWLTYSGKADLSNWPGDILIAPYIGQLIFDGPVNVGGSLLIGSNYSVWFDKLEVGRDSILMGSFKADSLATGGDFTCFDGDAAVRGDVNCQGGMHVMNGEISVDGALNAASIWSQGEISAGDIATNNLNGYISAAQGPISSKGSIKGWSIKADSIHADRDVIATHTIWSAHVVEAGGTIQSDGGISAGDYIKANVITASQPILAGTRPLGYAMENVDDRVVCQVLNGTIGFGKRADKT